MTSLPAIGVRLHGGLPARTCIDLAKVAEESGFSALWFAENAFNRGVFPAVAGSILATERLRVGIGVFNPYNRHPTLMAMEVGALDELAPGRARLGIGSGIGDRVQRMGLSYDKPLGACRDTIAIVRGMFSGERFTYKGAVFSALDAKLEFPVPRPDMPIYMAAMGSKALALVGEISDGLMISNMCPPGYTKRAVGLVAEGASRVGRTPPAEIIQYVQCVVRRDRKEARDLAKMTIGRMLAEYWALGEASPTYRDAMFRDSGIAEDEMIRAVERLKAGEPGTAALDDRFIDAYTIAGDVDDFIAGAHRFASVGVTELIVTIVGPTPADDMRYLGAGLARVA